MPLLLRRCLFAVTAALSCACSPPAPAVANDRDAAAGDAAALSPHERFSLDFVRAYCDAAIRCPDPASLDLGARPALRTVDRCVALVGPKLRETLRQYGAAVAAGRARFNETEGQRCVEAVRAVCTQDLEVLLGRYCARAYEGVVATGGACRLTAECAGDSFCQTTGSPCGVCRPRASIGSECPGGYDRCARSVAGWSECDFGPVVGATAGACRAARLVTGAGVAQPCGVRRSTDGTIERVVCADGAWCTAARGADGVCRAHVAPGAACVEEDVCAGAALCVVAPGGTAGACTAVALADAVGAPCEEVAGVRCDPASNLRCASGVCQRLGDGSAGARCEAGATTLANCREGLACIGATSETSTCQALLPAGAACASNRACASGWCEGTPRRCVDGAC